MKTKTIPNKQTTTPEGLVLNGPDYNGTWYSGKRNPDNTWTIVVDDEP